MTTTLYGIRNCDTMKKARAWLDAHGLPYAFHDFKVAGIERDALERWCDALGWEFVLNRNGTTFRALADREKEEVDRDRAVALMLAQPSMIKRPILDHDGEIVAGFKPDLYAARFVV